MPEALTYLEALEAAKEAAEDPWTFKRLVRREEFWVAFYVRPAREPGRWVQRDETVAPIVQPYR